MIRFKLFDIIRFFDNGGMVFIAEQYQTKADLTHLRDTFGLDYEFELDYSPAVCSIHLQFI